MVEAARLAWENYEEDERRNAKPRSMDAARKPMPSGLRALRPLAF